MRIIIAGAGDVGFHLAKLLTQEEQDIALKAGDRVRVRTPGGGGYGDPAKRDPELTAHDKKLGRI